MPKYYQTLKRTLPIIVNRDTAVRVGFSFGLTLAGIGANIVAPYTLASAISSFTADKVNFIGLELTPIGMIGIYGGIYTLSGLITNLRQAIVIPIGAKAEKKISAMFCRSLMEQSLDYHESTPAGEHNTRFVRCFTSMPNVSTQGLSNIIPVGLEINVVFSIVSAKYGYEVGMGLLGTLAAYSCFSIVTKKAVSSLRDRVLEEGLPLYADFGSMTANFKNVQIFNNREHELEKIDSTLERYTTVEGESFAIIPIVGVGQAFFAGLGFLLVSLLVARHVVEKDYTVDDLVAVIAYLIGFSGPLNLFGSALNQFGAGLQELESVFTEIDKKPAIINYNPGRALATVSDHVEVKFENVTFYYDEKNPILKDASFIIGSGKKTGIVGTSGVGKSTIAKLIFRLIEPKSGRILLNGEDIKDLDVDILRSYIAEVSQQTVLFNQSLYYNIAYGGLACPGGVNDEQVVDAIDKACLSDLVAKLPKGYDSKVGERGAKLSGGQLQRVGLARALSKRTAKIFIFDEATSALDPIVEREVQASIDQASYGRTSIVIAHRLSTLENSDSIIVLDNGCAVEQGSHADLLAIPNGVYANLWRTQQRTQGEAEISEVDDKKAQSSYSHSGSRSILFHYDNSDEAPDLELGSSLNLRR